MPPTRTPKQTSRRAASTPIVATDESASESAHIPRPPNPFMLYRKDTVAQLKKDNKSLYESMNQKLLSKVIGPKWRHAPAEVRQKYDGKAKEALQELMRKHPDYKYRPITKAKRDALQAAKKKAADEKKARADEEKARADEEKAAKAAARATRTGKTPSENDAPTPGPSQATAPRRKSKKSASSTSAAGSRRSESRDVDDIPGTGMFSLFDSDTESRLSSATPELQYEGETLQSLPFPLQATATALVTAFATAFVQYIAPGFPPAPDASYSAPGLVQGWSPQARGGDLLPDSATVSPALSNASDPLGLSREWYGLPPRDFFDETFPRHLPIAGLEGPIDLEDVVFALNNSQATGVAWLAHPHPVFVDAALPGQSPASAYDSPDANGDGTLTPAIDALEVHHAMDQPVVDAASPALTSEDSDMIDRVLAETFGTYRKSVSCAELQAEIDELNRFLETLDEIESMGASL